VLTRLRERPLRAFGVARFVHGARRAVARLGPFDDVVAHWIVPSAWPVALAAEGRLEVVLHGSDVRLVERFPPPVRRAVAASLLARGARFRFVSRELEARFARATTGAVLARSRVEPCAIDVDPALPRATLRARLGLGKETVAVVAGRLTPEKDPERAVRIAARHAHTVVVVGDGPLEPALRARFPEVRFEGRLSRPETLTWIGAADWLVSASRAEGASTVVREARALGTKVLAVAAGDIAERAASDPGIRIIPGSAA
jgi:teichuronic acid biosynthesis glycosyltransferase TuaC